MKATPVIIPDLGEIVTAVRIVRWMKQVGEPVAADEALLEISTDKMDVIIESPVAGVVAEIRVSEGERVPIGTAVATIDVT
jgi:pyruvate dehydrogenase E2 component (dihydrolipoamide acetyltransferase)